MSQTTQQHTEFVLGKRNLAKPDEVKSTANSKVEILHIGGKKFSRYTFFPGFRWTKEVKPLMGTDFCPFLHIPYQISGRIRVRLESGEEIEIGPGDAHVIPPGHDGWVVGDEPAVAVTIE